MKTDNVSSCCLNFGLSDQQQESHPNNLTQSSRYPVWKADKSRVDILLPRT